MFGFLHDPIGNPTAGDLHRLLGFEYDIEQLQDVRFARDLCLDNRGKELNHARADVVDQRVDDL